MTDLSFWKTVSNYSIVVCGIVLILKMFFREYIEGFIWPVLYLGGIALVIFVFSELMKFLIKRKNND